MSAYQISVETDVKIGWWTLPLWVYILLEVISSICLLTPSSFTIFVRHAAAKVLIVTCFNFLPSGDFNGPHRGEQRSHVQVLIRNHVRLEQSHFMSQISAGAGTKPYLLKLVERVQKRNILLIHHLISFTDHLPALGFSHVFHHKQRTWWWLHLLGSSNAHSHCCETLSYSIYLIFLSFCQAKKEIPVHAK